MFATTSLLKLKSSVVLDRQVTVERFAALVHFLHLFGFSEFSALTVYDMRRDLLLAPFITSFFLQPLDEFLYLRAGSSWHNFPPILYAQLKL